jgi:hypothetical protein
MPSAKELEDYARECVRLAGLADSQELREKLLAMAREWMSAAMDAEGSDAGPPPLPEQPRTRQ